MRTRSTIFGFAILIVLLTAGAAQSLSGSNTVFSDDIVDGTITTPDLKTGALSGSKILDNSVTGTDINESTIPGFKKVYFARVMYVYADGTESGPQEARLYGGDATGVTAFISGDVRFVVTFAQDISACAPSVTAGLVPGLVSPEVPLNAQTKPVAHTTITADAPDRVTVRFKSGSTPSADSFSLVLVCP